MSKDEKFAPPSAAAVIELVEQFPLAWIISAVADDFCATPLPLRPFVGASGELTQLIGHFARSNRHVQILRDHPRALVLFMGPHGYISPSWMADRTQAPTWNYVSAQFVVDIEFIAETAELDDLMQDMVQTMEAGRPRAWQISDMGARYQGLSRGVVGFRAPIQSRRVKFKLGQDERDDVYADIVTAIAAGGDAELLSWMRRSNPGRGE